MESPAGSGDAAAVCCMCGDHGLTGELFQCGLCLLRLQHRYCSELYPREAAYRSCNWCLRGGGRNPPVKTAPMVASKRLRRHSGSKASPSCGYSTRTAFKAEPGKPVKKLKKTKGLGRTTEQQPVLTAATNGRREAQAGGGRTARRFGVKVRRYKLLAEVIC